MGETQIKRYSLSGCFLLLLLFSKAQNNSWTKDSLTAKFKKDSAHIYRFKKIRPYIAFDNRNSFIRKDPVNLQGFQVGFMLFEQHTMGFGIYSIKKESRAPVKVTDQNKVANQYLRMGYLTTFYQYTIIDSRFFEMDLPLEFGLGGYHITIVDSASNKVLHDTHGGMLLSGGGISIVLKPLKWIGVSGMAGYRTVLDRNPGINFNGFYYSYGLWIDLRQIYRDVRFYGFTRKKYRREIKKLSASSQ